MQRPLYFIGWDYHSPQSTPLKQLLAHSLSPWKAMAIVHDETYVSSVDGISLLRTQEFVDLCRRTPGLQAILKVKDPVHIKRWHRQAKELGITLLDDGEIFQTTSEHLRQTGAQMNLSVMALPHALEAEHAQALLDSMHALPDPLSRQTLRAYVHFIETGLLDGLRAATQPEAGHPLSSPNSWIASRPWTTAAAPALAWEVAPQCSGFLDQALLLTSARLPQWTHAFSTETREVAEQEGRRLRALWAPFGVEPHIAKATQPSLPIPHPRFIVAHVDQANPLPLLQRLATVGCATHLRVRLGHNVGQLVELLTHFGDTTPILRCDRPGPFGLHMCLALNEDAK